MIKENNFEYVDERFPEDISLGAIGGPEYKTEIIHSLNGKEQRNSMWSNARVQYIISYTAKDYNNIYRILAFFRARKGRAIGFRFKDWSDYRVEKEIVGIGDDVKCHFQLIKTYKSGKCNEIRLIDRPVQNTMQIFIDDKIISSEQYNIEYNKGIISFLQPPKKGGVIAVSAEFDVLVRFDNDQLAISIDDNNVYSCRNIKLVEIK